MLSVLTLTPSSLGTGGSNLRLIAIHETTIQLLRHAIESAAVHIMRYAIYLESVLISYDVAPHAAVRMLHIPASALPSSFCSVLLPGSVHGLPWIPATTVTICTSVLAVISYRHKGSCFRRR